MSEIQTSLRFESFEIIKIDVKRYNDDSQSIESEDGEFDLKQQVFYPQENKNKFSIYLLLNIDSNENFSVSVTAKGNFETSTKISPELKLSFINTNAPAILYPYLRGFISTLTSNMGKGFSPIILPIMFFNGNLEEIDSEE